MFLLATMEIGCQGAKLQQFPCPHRLPFPCIALVPHTSFQNPPDQLPQVFPRVQQHPKSATNLSVPFGCTETHHKKSGINVTKRLGKIQKSIIIRRHSPSQSIIFRMGGPRPCVRLLGCSMVAIVCTVLATHIVMYWLAMLGKSFLVRHWNVIAFNKIFHQVFPIGPPFHGFPKKSSVTGHIKATYHAIGKW